MAREPHDWQLQCRELKRRGSHLLQSGVWSDCSFLVGTEPHQVSVPGHKLILSMASPVFEAMFYGSLAETSNKPIPIKDILPEAFKSLLEYIYTDKINISCVTNACAMYYGAKKYMLPHLMKKCMRYIWASLCPKNVCYVYEFAKMFDLRNLLNTCEQVIEWNASEVLQDSSFEELEPSTVVEVFSLRLRVSSELELFAAAERRARLCTADDMLIRSMIQKIRFLTLTPQQFTEGPARSGLLTKDEVLAVLTNIVTSDSHLPLPDGFSACRQRAGPADKITILDLNEECWELVLDYVPVADIISLERVSREWQNMALRYLTNTGIGIEFETEKGSFQCSNIRLLNLTQHTLPGMSSASFELWCRKLGSSVEITCCASEACLKTLRELCPNLRAVVFFDLLDNILQKHTDTFKKLEYLCFSMCDVSDSCIAKFVANLKRLIIKGNTVMTGECLLNINPTNIKSLFLIDCKALEFSHLSSAVERFNELLELALECVPQEIYENIHRLLRNTPNLKRLVMENNAFKYISSFKAVCKLSRLELLSWGFYVTNADLEVLVRSCNNLRSLKLGDCRGVTGRALRTACELAGARLTELNIARNSRLTNNDVAACIQACPNLESLNVSGLHRVTPELLPLAAAACRAADSRRPLNLHLRGNHYVLRSSQQVAVLDAINYIL